MKMLPVGGELFLAGGWTDGHTDMTKPIVGLAILRTRQKTPNCHSLYASGVLKHLRKYERRERRKLMGE